MKKKRMSNPLVIAVLTFMALSAGIFLTGIKSEAAGQDLSAGEYITKIKIISSDVSEETAAEDGWKVMSDRIGGSSIAYQTGNSEGEALRGLCLVKSGSASESDSEITYQEIGSIGGAKLCGTKDSGAGGAIVGLKVINKPLLGDGSHTVRDENGEVVDIGENQYLATIHAGQTGKYISGMAKIRSGSENTAIKTAANQGYDFFRLIRDEDGMVELIAYNRTNDKEKAVRAIYTVGEEADYKLFYSVSPAAGAPIVDVELKEVSEILWEGDTFELGEWAKMTFGSGVISDAASYVLQDETYRKLTADTEKYRWNPVSIFATKAELGQALTDLSQGDTLPELVVAQADGESGGDGEIELFGVDMEKFLSEEDEGKEEEKVSEEEKTDGEDGENGENSAEEPVVNDEPEFGASDTPKDMPVMEEGSEEGGEEAASGEEAAEGESGSGDEKEGEAGKEGEPETVGSLIGSGSFWLIILGVVVLAGITLVGIFYRKRGKGGDA